jgi:hypothetical protein
MAFDRKGKVLNLICLFIRLKISALRLINEKVGFSTKLVCIILVKTKNVFTFAPLF